MATNFLFNRNGILSFIFSLKSLLQLEGDPYLNKNLKSNLGQFLKKNIILAHWNHFFGFLQVFLWVEANFSG